jgi:hypothetical protein
MSSVFRPKRRLNGKVRVARIYVGQFRLAGDVKATRVALGVIDKEVAKEKLRRIVREAEREREGLIPPKEERDAIKNSIEGYVQEYAESRRGLNRDEKYVGELERKLFRLIRECGWSKLVDVTALPHRSHRIRSNIHCWRIARAGGSGWRKRNRVHGGGVHRDSTRRARED